MKTAIVGVLALGLIGPGVRVRAENRHCCPSPGSTPAACCSAAAGKVCLDAHDITVAELAQRLGSAIGSEVRVQGPAYEKVTLKVCAPNAEAALAQVASAVHARWRPAYVFGEGMPASKTAPLEACVSVTFRNAAAASAAYLTAAQAGGVLISARPLTGKVTFQGKNVPVGMALDAVALAAGVNWKHAYLLETGPDSLVSRHQDRERGIGEGVLHTRPGSPLTHLHHSPTGGESIAPAPGMLVKDPQAELARLEKEAMRRQELGEWAGVFTQESPKDTKRAIRDLRIRVETTIQKLEAYPPQNRELGMAMWRARYERMQEDFKHLTPEQQKQVQPVLDAMKYFAPKTN